MFPHDFAGALPVLEERGIRDLAFELLEALLLASIIRSADDVSQSANFRRRFASVYDDWDNGKIDPLVLRQALVARLLFCNKWRRDVPSRASQGPA